MIGEEFLRFFYDACAYDRLEVVIVLKIHGHDTEFHDVARQLKAANADAVAYLGEGIAACYLNKAFTALDWNPVRVMSSGFMSAPFLPEGIGSIKGWVGVDQYDEENTIGQAVLDRFEKRYGYRPQNLWPLINYDFANVIAHGLLRAFPMSPKGFKTGLERIKMLPAANGGARGLISFGPYQRRGWINPDFMVLREVDPNLDESIDSINEGGDTVMRHKFTPRIFA